MSTRPTRTRWPSRVDPLKIRQLYESDAQGMLDVKLLDDVGYGIHVRCQALLEVSAARRGKVQCWDCDSIIPRQQGQKVEYTGHGPTLVGGKSELLTCDRCGWQITWEDCCRSTSGQGLNATGVEDVLGTYVKRWPVTRSSHARLILIDTLIHAFHCWDSNTIGSPVGATVIRATPEGVLALLDELAYGPGSTLGIQQTREQWAGRVKAKEAQRPLSELRTIARQLGIVGRSRMRRAALQAAIERVAPERLARPME